MSVHQTKFLKLRPQPLPGFIYLVQAVGTDKFKIGRAGDVARRIKELQTGSPLKIRYVYHAYVHNANLCEMELHNKFSKQREIGEWFALTQEDIEFCILLMRLVQEGEPLESEEELKNPLFTDPIVISSSDLELWWKVEAAQVEGKTTTWIVENILGKKGRKFSEGKKQLEELVKKFGGQEL
ncbi:GIY-YIG nuclease family protein [Microcoleus sp. S13_C5]|uniref:GIY-YIG nuclease family protein n=1 Tax=Microcoleus sp. S13_C5 TaxID=3055411 RepID=UPI002FD10F7C